MFEYSNITNNEKKVYLLTPMDFEMILAYVASPLMAILLRLCFLTGTEINNLLELTYTDLSNLNSGFLKIRLLYGRIPDIPIDDGVRQMLQPYAGEKPGREFFFTHDDGSTWSSAYVDSQISEISEKSGILFTADSLRESYFNTVVNNVLPQGRKRAKNKMMKEMISGLAA